MTLLFYMYLPRFRCWVDVDNFVVFHLTFGVGGFENWVWIDAVNLIIVDDSLMDRDYSNGPLWQGL